MSNLTQAELKAAYHYDPGTGEFTYLKSGKPVKACSNPERYVFLKIGSYTFSASRAAFLYMLGRWPNRLVDHINRNRSDNRWCNLRECEYALNNANCFRSNSTGYRGVTKLGNLYRAKTKVDRKTICLGYFKTAEEAHAAYCQFMIARFGDQINLKNKK